MNLKISALIPAYNRKDFQQKAPDCALKQDYQNLEIIVTDNASTVRIQTLLPKITNVHQIIKGIDYFCYCRTGEYQPFTYGFRFRRTQSLLDFDASDDGFTELG